MSAEEYESLLETLDILSRRSEVKAIVEGVKQIRRKETVPLHKFLAKRQTSRQNGKR
jgi:PHD/YefM family antitoxin component YafN of YafNO toxin-antitoxin module